MQPAKLRSAIGAPRSGKSAFALLVALVASTVVCAALAANRPPNLLVVLIDNLGKDWFGCYGAPGGHTPNIDRLAATGVRFDNFYVTPLCSTTRVQLLTGRYPFRTGWHTHHDAGFYGGGGLNWNRETTWARVLKSAGYATLITGKWQVNDLYGEPDALTRHGFDEHLVWSAALAGEGTAEQRWLATKKKGPKGGYESRYWDPVVFRNGIREHLKGKFAPDEFLNFTIDFMARHRNRPFVAYFSSTFASMPVVPMPPNSGKSDAPLLEQFAAMVRYMDKQVGRLEQELVRLGLRENTIILLMTDDATPGNVNGPGPRPPRTGTMGRLNEGGLVTPLIANCPGRVPKGQVNRELVDASDLFPTLLELAGVSIPAGLAIDGRSFAGQIGGTSQEPGPRAWMFSQYATTRLVRDRRFKLFSTGEFFDLVADPLEQRNLAPGTDREARAARIRLQQVLDRLPPDADVGFAFRSGSAFEIQTAKEKR